jgi:adenylate cyclase
MPQNQSPPGRIPSRNKRLLLGVFKKQRAKQDRNATEESLDSELPANESLNLLGVEHYITTHLPLPSSRPSTVVVPTADALWVPPESWGVASFHEQGPKRHLPTEGESYFDESTNMPFTIRIYRKDSTFVVLTVPLNTTAESMIQFILKKSFMDDAYPPDHCILLRKGDVLRQLEAYEQPLVIQRRLLEQAGYESADSIQDVGRLDHSYLCRFTISLRSVMGKVSLEDDLDLTRFKTYASIDLQARQLLQIPIDLFRHASDITSLNLSRNPALSLPTDFIALCARLNHFIYTHNEAAELPSALTHARKLSVLDASHNRLQQLDNSCLNGLQNLISLRLTNNKLQSVPKYIGSYRSLRSLDLSSNYLEQLPECICQIQTLTELDISCNSIFILPKVEKLVSLQRFIARNNKITGALPASFSALHELRDVDIGFNSVDNIDVLSRLAKLKTINAGYNAISEFNGFVDDLSTFRLDHNPLTRFNILGPANKLEILDLSATKLAGLRDDMFLNTPALQRLLLDENFLVSLPSQIGSLIYLQHLSVSRNCLNWIPSDIGSLQSLQYLDIRENNLQELPRDIWMAARLEYLNVSCNVLESFPSFPESKIDLVNADTEETTAGTSLKPIPGSETLKERRRAMISRRSFVGSLRYLHLAENRLSDEVFAQLARLEELRVVNLSYNIISNIPPRALRQWIHLSEMYLSGNELRVLPSEDLEALTNLSILHLNGNGLQTLPAELAKLSKLSTLDVGSNSLKYNVNNWPYDWNWNWNYRLKYLNLSSNSRLEIIPSLHKRPGEKDLSDFSRLSELRVLGLMEITLRVTVPDQTDNLRVRTIGAHIGILPYGLADSLGKDNDLSIVDMALTQFRGNLQETVVGMFDSQNSSNRGSKIARYLRENFPKVLKEQIDALRSNETPQDAIRRTYLQLNHQLALGPCRVNGDWQLAWELASRTRQQSLSDSVVGIDASLEGCAATVLYLSDSKLYVSNIGDAEAILIQSEGGHRVITQKHVPTSPSELCRITNAGGFVSSNGKLNDQLHVSRSFGYLKMAPAINAAPKTTRISLQENDELIVIASGELWKYLSYNVVVDYARTERNDLMIAAQKLRDLAIAFGATHNILVMILGVQDLKRKQQIHMGKGRKLSLSLQQQAAVDDWFTQSVQNAKRNRNIAIDSKLMRLDQEIEAPTGQVALVFTDIVNSILLWDTYPTAMASAQQMHNELMRRQSRIIGGYEVKMDSGYNIIAFPTATGALLWCFAVQMQLLELPWPLEILNSVHGQEIINEEGNIIFRGLQIRMGIHWGTPVVSTDPITKRMAYYGPMVNRASRISSIAQGGQIIASSEFIWEIQRLLEMAMDEVTTTPGNEEYFISESISPQVTREIRSLNSIGFEVQDMGERWLKGLENPEFVYLMLPHPLGGRIDVYNRHTEANQVEHTLNKPSSFPKATTTLVNVDDLWRLWHVSARLEMLCESFETGEQFFFDPPEGTLFENLKLGVVQMSDNVLINLLESQVFRIEVFFLNS